MIYRQPTDSYNNAIVQSFLAAPYKTVGIVVNRYMQNENHSFLATYLRRNIDSINSRTATCALDIFRTHAQILTLLIDAFGKKEQGFDVGTTPDILFFFQFHEKDKDHEQQFYMPP